MAKRDGPGPGTLPQTAVENIEAMTRLREEAWQQRSWGERAADHISGAIGRVAFVGFHLAWFVVWVVVNSGLIRVLPRFDPYPYNMFSTLVSLEAVIIAAFVLIKQNRMARLDERRGHVELQMILLSEKEVTKLLRIMQRVTAHLGIPDAVDEETRELGEHKQVEDVARAVRDNLPPN